MRVVLRRSKWGPSTLFNSETGRMCCLGTNCSAHGVQDGELEGVGMPSCLDDKRFKVTPNDEVLRLFKKCGARYHNFCARDLETLLATVNDRYHRVNIKNESAVIALIRAGFKQIGDTLVWRPDL